MDWFGGRARDGLKVSIDWFLELGCRPGPGPGRSIRCCPGSFTFRHFPPGPRPGQFDSDVTLGVSRFVILRHLGVRVLNLAENQISTEGFADFATQTFPTSKLEIVVFVKNMIGRWRKIIKLIRLGSLVLTRILSQPRGCDFGHF